MQRAIKKAVEWNVLHDVGTCFGSQEVHRYCRPFTVTNCFNSDNGAEVEGRIDGHPQTMYLCTHTKLVWVNELFLQLLFTLYYGDRVGIVRKIKENLAFHNTLFTKSPHKAQ